MRMTSTPILDETTHQNRLCETAYAKTDNRLNETKQLDP